MIPGEPRSPAGLQQYTGSIDEMHRMITNGIAKIILDQRYTFISPILASMDIVIDKHMTDIAACNGISLFIERPFFMYPQEQQISILVHEALHVFLLHTIRRGNRDPKQWNIACDYIVNDNVVETFNLPLPNGGLFYKGFENWSAEQLYAWIGENQEPPNSKGANSGEPVWEPVDVKDTPAESEVEVMQKVQRGLGAGYNNIPTAWREYLLGILQPQVPWEDVLKEFMLEKVKENYRFGPFRRGHIYRGIYMPTLNTEEAHIVIAIDTSGSISSEQLQMFLTETGAISSTGFISGIVILSTDIPYWQFEFPPVPTMEEIKEHLMTGGTAFNTTFEGIEGKYPEEINGIIYFTDGLPNTEEGWGTEPPYPVLWALTEGDVNVPFGEKLVLPKMK